MLAFTPCCRATPATDAPGNIASSTILRFSAMLRRCRLCPSTFITAELSTITSRTTSLQVMISLAWLAVQTVVTGRLPRTRIPTY